MELNTLFTEDGAIVPPRPSLKKGQHGRITAIHRAVLGSDCIAGDLPIIKNRFFCPSLRAKACDTLIEHYVEGMSLDILLNGFKRFGWLVNDNLKVTVSNVAARIEQAAFCEERLWAGIYKPVPPFEIGGVLNMPGDTIGVIERVSDCKAATYVVKVLSGGGTTKYIDVPFEEAQYLDEK